MMIHNDPNNKCKSIRAATDDPVSEAECLEQAARCWRMANKMPKACELYGAAARLYLQRNRPIKEGIIYDLISKLPNISTGERIPFIRHGIDAFEQANDVNLFPISLFIQDQSLRES